MTELETEMLKELKKMNGFLEAIDWKLWNMHKKFVEGGAVATTTSVEKVADAQRVETFSPAVDTGTTIPSIPKYPSIEKYS